MPLTAQLVEALPNRLRYLISESASPPGATTITVPNAAGPTPDLRTDILAGTARSTGGARGTTLQSIIRAALDGFGPLPAAALTQAQARAIMNSEDPTNAVLTNILVGRAVTTVMPRTGVTNPWSVDINVDGSGNPVVAVTSGGVVVATAILDIELDHTLGG